MARRAHEPAAPPLDACDFDMPVLACLVVHLAVPLYQLDGDALGTLEEPQLSVDVVHLVAEHRHAISHEVCSGCLKVVDAEGEMIEA